MKKKLIVQSLCLLMFFFASNLLFAQGRVRYIPDQKGTSLPVIEHTPQFILQTTNMFRSSGPKYFYNDFVKHGVPAYALRDAIEYYSANIGKNVRSKGEKGAVTVPFKNDRYMMIVNFSLASDEKRLYLLDLKTGAVEKYLVSHGTGTGGKWAYRFSNTMNSKKTSLGFFITGPTYMSQNFGGTAMKIFGTQASNDMAYARTIVIHPAEYASPDFIQRRIADSKMSRLGRSFGCFALDPAFSAKIIEKLKGGALIYSYFDEKIAGQAEIYPDYQSVNHEWSMKNPDYDNPPPTDEEMYQLSGLMLKKKRAEMKLKATQK